VLAALAGYEWELAAVRRMMEQGDEAALAEWLATAQVNYAAYRRFKSSEYLLSIREDDEEAGKIA